MKSNKKESNKCSSIDIKNCLKSKSGVTSTTKFTKQNSESSTSVNQILSNFAGDEEDANTP